MDVDDIEWPDDMPAVPLTDAQRRRFEAAAARALSEIQRRAQVVNPETVGRRLPRVNHPHARRYPR